MGSFCELCKKYLLIFLSLILVVVTAFFNLPDPAPLLSHLSEALRPLPVLGLQRCTLFLTLQNVFSEMVLL